MSLDGARAAEPYVVAPTRTGRPRSELARRWLRRPEAGVLPVTVGIFLVFSVASPFFLTAGVWGSIVTLGSELAIVAIFVTLLMVAGEFDLSVGSVFGMTAVLVPALIVSGVTPWFATVVTLAFCVVIGFMNGVLVTKLGVHSLIITIGGLMLYRSVALLVTNGLPIHLDPSQVGAFWPINTMVGGFSVEGIWAAALAILLIIVLTKTEFGNWIFASGGDANAANSTGVPVTRVKIALFAVTSLAAGFAGILQMARLTSVDALGGTGLELEAVLAAVVGGTYLTGGYGGVFGTILGVLVLAMAKLGLVLVGIPAYWYQAGIGMFLVITAAGNGLLARRRFR